MFSRPTILRPIETEDWSFMWKHTERPNVHIVNKMILSVIIRGSRECFSTDILFLWHFCLLDPALKLNENSILFILLLTNSSCKVFGLVLNYCEIYLYPVQKLALLVFFILVCPLIWEFMRQLEHICYFFIFYAACTQTLCASRLQTLVYFDGLTDQWKYQVFWRIHVQTLTRVSLSVKTWKVIFYMKISQH